MDIINLQRLITRIDRLLKECRHSEAIIDILVKDHSAQHSDLNKYSLRLAGICATSEVGNFQMLRNWKTAAYRKIAEAQDNCAGHVASASDPKVCGRCGIHIDELRPDDDGDPTNLAGSGPVPIEPREG